MHDFFQAQQRTAPHVFLLRMILHDWANSYAQKILQPLREAAGPNTTLVIVDNVVPYACKDDSPISNSIPGGGAPPAPEPLLENMGVVNAHNYLADVQVCLPTKYSAGHAADPDFVVDVEHSERPRAHVDAV